MLDMVFIQPPFWGTTTPPLGLATLKAKADLVGYRTKCIDLNIELYQWASKKDRKFWQLSQGYSSCENKTEVLNFYLEFHSFLESLKDGLGHFDPTQVWITVQSSSSLFTSLLVGELRDFDVVLGGPQIWSFMEAGLEVSKLFPGIFNYYSGEGELLIGRRNDDGHVKDLDSLPFPDFADFDLMDYDFPNSLPISFGRGCINRCVYCSERGLHGGVYRYRTGISVFEEMVYQISMNPRVFFFHFHDSVSNGNVKELEAFCDLMIDSGLGKRVRWSMGNSTIRKEMRRPLYEKMKRAGCTFIGYGLETPVPRLLRAIGKSSAVGVDLEAVVREGFEAGIRINLNFMFGLPGETDEDFDRTIQFVRENRDYIYQVNPALNLCGFFPGSRGYRNPGKYGIRLSDNPITWTSVDDKNNYTVRSERFRRFVEEAGKLGIRNFFGETPVPAVGSEDLHYPITLSNYDNHENVAWFVHHLAARMFYRLIRRGKALIRRFYYARL